MSAAIGVLKRRALARPLKAAFYVLQRTQGSSVGGVSGGPPLAVAGHGTSTTRRHYDDQVDDQTNGRRLTRANPGERSQGCYLDFLASDQGRDTPGTGLEIVCPARDRGFKSHPLRSK